MSFPPIYVVSLARGVARRAAMCERLDALGLGYEVVDAVDGAVADPDIYREWDKTLRRCYGVMNPAPKVKQ